MPRGRDYLVVAARPFPALQPDAETGPIFLCAEACSPWRRQGMPPALTTSPDYLLRGYSAANRIVYGTGGLVPASGLPSRAEAILQDAEVAYVDDRSARNNCFQARIRRRE